MASENLNGNENESAKKLRSNTGTFLDGKWYCDCHDSPEAEFYMAGRGTKNAGKYFWRCKKSRSAGCKFWLLEEDEELRKARLVSRGILNLPVPKTPTPNKRKRGEDPMSLYRGDGNQNVIELKEESPTRTLVHEDDVEDMYFATPSRKATKTTAITTPRQTTREMAPEPTTPGPSSQSAVASRIQALDVFSTPNQPQREIDPSNQPKSMLAAAILDLLKSKGIQLDDLIVMKIEHMVGLEVDQHEAAVGPGKSDDDESGPIAVRPVHYSMPASWNFGGAASTYSSTGGLGTILTKDNTDPEKFNALILAGSVLENNSAPSTPVLGRSGRSGKAASTRTPSARFSNTDWLDTQPLKPRKREEEGLQKSNGATGEARLDPERRQMLVEEVPNLKEQEERQRIEVKSRHIEEWRSQAGGYTPEGEEITVHTTGWGYSFFPKSPSQTSYEERNIESDEGNEIMPLGDDDIDHENRRLEGQVYYTKRMRNTVTEVDLALLALPRHWNDAPSFPEASTTQHQPLTSNEASERWKRQSDAVSNASRAATCGSLSEPSMYDLKYGPQIDAFVERVSDDGIKEETRRPNSIFEQGLAQLSQLANIVPTKSDSQLKRARSSQNVPAETGNKPHDEHDSKRIRAGLSSGPRVGLPSVKAALEAMAGPLAAAGEGRTRTGSISPSNARSPQSPPLSGFDGGERLGPHDRNAQGVIGLFNPHGRPPPATFSRRKLSTEEEVATEAIRQKTKDEEKAIAYEKKQLERAKRREEENKIDAEIEKRRAERDARRKAERAGEEKKERELRDRKDEDQDDRHRRYDDPLSRRESIRETKESVSKTEPELSKDEIERLEQEALNDLLKEGKRITQRSRHPLELDVDETLALPPRKAMPSSAIQPISRDSPSKDEGEDEMFENIKEVDLSKDHTPIVPNYEGFKAHVLRLNPDMDPRYMWLVNKIAHQQEIRYKNLLEMKVKHSQAVQAGNCSAGTLCLTLGRAATSFGRGERMIIEHSGIITLLSEDDTSPSLAEATFPPGVPVPPTRDFPAAFECQLCFKAQNFQNSSDWVKHVHGDLQTFTCTYDTCKEPMSFKRKVDWVRHENERHRHLEWWICQVDDCRHPSYRKDNFLQHLVEEHQLPEPKKRPKFEMVKEPAWIMLEQCHHDTTTRPQDEPCKFCGKAFATWEKLIDHLAKHLENISLPILQLVAQIIVDENTVISPVEYVVDPISPTRRSPFPESSSKISKPFDIMGPPWTIEKNRQSKDESAVAGIGYDIYDDPDQVEAYHFSMGTSSYPKFDKPIPKAFISNDDDDGYGISPPTTPPPSSQYGNSKLESIRHFVVQNLSDDAPSVLFTIYWDLRGFIRHQYGDVPISIGSVITLNGTAVAAQATTCQDYVRTNWPTYGLRVLWALQEALDSSETTSTFDSLGVSIFINLGAPTVLVTARGPQKAVVEVAQLFAWMGAAMRVSSSEKLQYSDCRLDLAAQGQFNITFNTAPLEKNEHCCWFPLFVNPVIARGFPIPPRENNEVGLELSVEMMAALAGVRYAVEYEGGLLLKGLSALCVPIKRYPDSIQWHFIHHDKPNVRMTYSEVKIHCPQRALLDEVSHETLQSTRAFVGWWKASRTYLGTNDYDYTSTAYSTAALCSRNAKLVGGALGFSKIGFGINISLGAKDSRLFLSRSGPLEQVMRWAEMMPILLYDVTDKRGWFVKATDVILHIIRTRHSKRPFKIDGKVVPLLGADPEHGDEASEKAIVQMSSLKLFTDYTEREKGYYVADFVSDIWALLERLSEAQNGEDMTPGKTIHAPLQVKIQGWEFMALVDQKSPLQRKEAAIEKTSGGWPNLIHDVNAVVLLAQHFGDLIRPLSSPELCARWRLIPKGKDYIAAGVPLLKKLCEEAGSSSPYLHLTPTKLQWHINSMLFEECQGSKYKNTACKCDRLQQVVAKSSLNGTINPPMILEDRGCVIFGKSQQGSRIPQPPTSVANGLYQHPNGHIVPENCPTSSSDDSIASSPESYSEFETSVSLESAHIHIQGCEGFKDCQCSKLHSKMPQALEDCFVSASSLTREGKSFDRRAQKILVQQHDVQSHEKSSTKRSFNVHEEPLPCKKRAHIDRSISPNSEYERALEVEPPQTLMALPFIGEREKFCTVKIVENPKAFNRVVPVDQMVPAESPKPVPRRSW